jgi:chromosome segregation protein
MRLKQIKLVGFKSFVDPTTVPFPENLTAVVGPNGCGKSNIIDAVRWVMGESSAKNLRGDAMVDVIFNGSSARKPVGQASVELVFDNSDGTLKGEYASYNELSIRRTVTRDGQSTYYLNGTRCRRKDITDIFLGTGLGPRSYAIIEQGMISRLIESKPQELRVFIEEAAGISKYKDRRRETENRIRHTRENLDRLSDLRDELGKQLGHLNRQAQAAERYKSLKAEERETRAQLTALRWKALDERLAEVDGRIAELEVGYQAKQAEHTSVDAQIEKLREAQIELNDQFNEVQGKYYGIGAEIARLEQGLKHRSEREQQLQQDLARVQQSLDQIQTHQTVDTDKEQQLLAELEALEPELELVNEEAEVASQRLMELEEQLQRWQAESDAFQLQSAGSRQACEIEKTKIQHLETLLTRSSQRLDMLNEEKTKLAQREDAQTLEQLASSAALLHAQWEEAKASADDRKATLMRLRDERTELEQQAREAQSQLQKLEARLQALRALQLAVMPDMDDDEGVFEELGLADGNTLAASLTVDPAWRSAVEAILGNRLLARTSARELQDVARILADRTGIPLPIVWPRGDDGSREDPTGPGACPTLSSKVDGPLPDWLAGIYCAEDLSTALSLREQLKPGQSLIVPEGLWLGRDWIWRLSHEDDKDSILAREEEIRILSERMEEQQSRTDTIVTRLQDVREALDSIEKEWQQEQDRCLVLGQEKAAAEACLEKLRAEIQSVARRMEQLDSEIGELTEQREEARLKLAEARGRLQEALDAMAEDEARREALDSRRDELKAMVAHAREQVRLEKEKAHRITLRAETLRTELQALRQGKSRAEEQARQLKEQAEELQLALEQNRAPVEDLKEQLEAMLRQHVDIESQLKAAREKLDASDMALRDAEKERLLHEQELDALRRRMEDEKLTRQSLAVQKETLLQQLQEHKVVLSEVVDSLGDATIESLEQRLADIRSRIERLGAINLAAIDEYKTQSERKTYLDQQHQDLVDALETLEAAIRKIDRETRTRFKETFDKINKGLQELFPKIFGGGHAYLELTGDDLLDTGVAIMARPPGKRNSTIHLLSGGEKAMTAIALVFAIFRLNPAPFCMLDEVDAPLDDANVGRYCDLVRDMSQHIQFIYISHNKQAMEMANGLVGVTMQEPGVSRMVSVDIEEAVALAAT